MSGLRRPPRRSLAPVRDEGRALKGRAVVQ
ncbi:protein of unknown function [Thauera humireducens]|nr:protein of unknown function [Thauera humireducens]